MTLREQTEKTDWNDRAQVVALGRRLCAEGLWDRDAAEVFAIRLGARFPAEQVAATLREIGA